MRISKAVSICLLTFILSAGMVLPSCVYADTLRLEAEDMLLSGYNIREATAASGGKIIQIGGSPEGIFQKATGYFNASDGNYDIAIRYVDVFSGSSTRKVYLNDKQIAVWAGNKTPGVSAFGTSPTIDSDVFKIKLISNVSLKKGDKIELVSRNDYGEHGEFDYIEFIPVNGANRDLSESEFTDVSSDHWAYGYIKNMAKEKVVNGYDDGSFRPEENLKVDQFIKLFVSVLGYSVDANSEYWAQPYIDKAEMLGFVENGEFDDFARQITRGEMIDVVSHIDVLSEHINDIIIGDEYGNLNLNKSLTRAEATTVLTRIEEILEEEFKSGVVTAERFDLDSDGYVKTWCTTGMVSTEKQRLQTVGDFSDFEGTEPPFAIPDEKSFSAILPNGMEFIPKSIGSNVYVMETIRAGENDGVYGSDCYLATDLYSDSETVVDALFRYQTGYYELWCNAEKIATAAWKWTPTQSMSVSLKLKKGVNRIFVRARNNGNRFALSTVGLQIMSAREKIKTSIPLDSKTIEDFYAAERWINKFSITDEGNLKAESVPVSDTYVEVNSKLYRWPKYESVLDFDKAVNEKPMYFGVSVNTGNTGMTRKMQVRNNVDFSNKYSESLYERQKAYTDYLVDNRISEGYCLGSELALKYSYGMPFEARDKERIINELKSIDTMMDCSDFNLGHMLRLYKLYGDRFDEEIKNAYKHTLLNFAYWNDEEDSGRMVFSSENHKIGFYTCMLIAGNLYPNDTFLRSGRSGKNQAELAEKRILDWISVIESDGFEEFQSSAYMDVTLAGMLNAYDFSDNAEIKSRMGALIDLLIKMTAVNTFNGISIGVQGRVYREIVDIESCIKQRMAAYLSPLVMWAEPTLWMVPLITSGYKIPEDIDMLISEPAELHFMQGGADVSLKKTKDYFISAVNTPTEYLISSPLAESYQPGAMMKQVHMVEASIGKDARAFITHPGAAVDNTGQRPDYWFGQLTAPASKMQGNTVMLIYDIPESAATQFTHIYWTSDRFDEEIVKDNRLYAKCGEGYLAVWCSEKLEKYDDLLLGREYRANTPKAAWVLTVSSVDESGTFEDFISNCETENPVFNEKTMTLSVNNQIKLKW